jgi:chromate reductase
MVLIGGISRGSLNRRFFNAVAALTTEISAGSGGTGASRGSDTSGSASASGASTGGANASGNSGASGASADGANASGNSGAPGGTSGASGSAHLSLEFTPFDIAQLPFYSQDIENDPPQGVVAMREFAAASDAVLIVTPEYNRSIPGVLKNALDWGSRPPGHNIWARKPTAIMGATTGGVGTFGAQQHLRNICSWLDMPVMNQPAVYFNASTGLADASGAPTADGDRLTDASAAFLRKFLAAFEQWIALLSK